MIKYLRSMTDVIPKMVEGRPFVEGVDYVIQEDRDYDPKRADILERMEVERLAKAAKRKRKRK